MGSKIELINEREQEELFEKIKFIYITRSNKHWKDQIPKLILLKKIKGIDYVDLENKSDFEIFKIFYPNDTTESKNHYFLVVDNIPVTYLTTNKQRDGMLDISIATDEDYQKQGYGTKTLELLEEETFCDDSVRGIQMFDLSKHQQTSKIAIKLNYQQNERGVWCKYNKNFKDIKVR